MVIYFGHTIINTDVMVNFYSLWSLFCFKTTFFMSEGLLERKEVPKKVMGRKASLSITQSLLVKKQNKDTMSRWKKLK